MSDSPEQKPRITAGEQLRHLREQQNFSIADIADRLNLEPRVIEAIEKNDMESMPAATYTRGYLRSYAKILTADAEAIVDAYNNNAPDAPEIIPEIKHPTQTSSSDKPVRAFTYLITLSLVILLAAWLYNNYIVDNISFGSNKANDSDQSVGLSYEYDIVEHPDTLFFPMPAQLLEVPGEAEESGEPELLVAEEDVALDDVPLEDVISAPLVTETISSNDDGPDNIVLRISADSWIQIRDAFDNKVFTSLATEGQTLELSGTAPFSVVLGYAAGVSVELNGKSFDTAPFTKGSIARFQLDN